MSELFSIDEAAGRLFARRVSPHSVRRWIAQGIGSPRVRLKARRVGGRYFVRRADVDEFQKALEDPGVFARLKKTERAERAKERLVKAGA